MGVPQGSPLSPILFNTYCDCLKDLTRDYIYILSYADSVIVGKGLNLGLKLEQIKEWPQEIGVNLPTEKCVAICLKSRGKTIPNSKIEIDGKIFQPLKNLRSPIFTNRLQDNEGRTGYGIYSNKDITYKGKIPNYATICDAIRKATILTEKKG